MADTRIEEVIGEVLHGDVRERALDFIGFLRGNEIPFKESGGYLDVHLNGKNVCSVLISGEDNAPGPWTIWSDQEPGTWIMWADGGEPAQFGDAAVDERTKEAVWAHVNYCASCGGDCSPGKTKIVLGKTFDGLCSSALAFTNPDAEGLECAKGMILARKRDILEAAGMA